MTNNDVLRRLRFALDMNDDAMVALFDFGGLATHVEQVRGWMGREDDPDALPCPSDILEMFLDALILKRRGPPPEHAKPPPQEPLSNNSILKKLRVALKLRDTDIVDLMALGGRNVSKAEVGALSRPRGHKNYRELGDQHMRAFLAGLTQSLRGDAS